MGWGFSGRTDLKFRPRSGVYRNSRGTCEFDPVRCEGKSYRWVFVRRINGKVIFNAEMKSRTTSSHQYAMRALLRDLKIKIDLVVYTDESLDLACAFAPTAIRSAIRSACDHHPEGSPLDLRPIRALAKILRFRLTDRFIAEVIQQKEEDRADRFLRESFARSEKKIREAVEKIGGDSYLFSGGRTPEAPKAPASGPIFPRREEEESPAPAPLDPFLAALEEAAGRAP